MSDHVMVVFTNPVTGKEDEYNRWYNEVAIPRRCAAGSTAVM